MGFSINIAEQYLLTCNAFSTCKEAGLAINVISGRNSLSSSKSFNIISACNNSSGFV